MPIVPPCADDLPTGVPADALLGEETIAAGGYAIETIDVGFLCETSTLLYDEAWLAERTAALETLLREYPGGDSPDGPRHRCCGRLEDCRRCLPRPLRAPSFHAPRRTMWRSIDMLPLSTAPTIDPVDEMLADPIARFRPASVPTVPASASL